MLGNSWSMDCTGFVQIRVNECPIPKQLAICFIETLQANNTMLCYVQVTELLKSGASDGALADAMVPIINSRFLQGHKAISSHVVQDARATLDNPVNIVKPGAYGKGAVLCTPAWQQTPRVAFTLQKCILIHTIFTTSCI